MGRIGFRLAWVFVVLVTAYDIHFAWRYRAGFTSWELNPVARWVATLYGLETVLALKIAAIGFALVVAIYCDRYRHYLARPYTLIVGAVHLCLSCQYLLGYIQGV
jgi:hypothetical protein